MNQAVLDKQLPAFQKMWREAFQSVADEVERISQEVGKRVEQDPLASIGMPRPAKPRSSLDSRGIGGSTGTKRRRREEDAKERVEAKAAAMSDPFARRRTRPQSYWTVGSGGGSLTEVSWSGVAPASTAALAAPATVRMGEYKCDTCEGLDTSFDVIGGASVGSRKAETFGNKDAPELVLRVVCHSCGSTWLEER
ncbi:unnamed protein product [Sphacelaria rigidula]